MSGSSVPADGMWIEVQEKKKLYACKVAKAMYVGGVANLRCATKQAIISFERELIRRGWEVGTR